MNDKPNYTGAFEELQEIVSEIEQGEISVDELAAKVKRAALLIKICKDKLPLPKKTSAKSLRNWTIPPPNKFYVYFNIPVTTCFKTGRFIDICK